MIGLISPLIFILFQTAIYIVFKRWTSKVNLSIDQHMSPIASLDSPLEEWDGVVAVLKFSETRKKAIKSFAFLLIGFFFVIELIAGLLTPREPEDTYLERLVAITAGICLCGLGPWVLLIEPYGSLRVVTINGILRRSPWTGTSFTRWDQIRSVRWVPFLDNFFVKTDQGLFAVNPVYENLDKFAEGIMRNVPKSKWARAERKLTTAMNGPFQP